MLFWFDLGLKNPITLMSYVTPAMAVVTLILSLMMDPWHDFDTNVYFDNSWHVFWSCVLMLTGGALAFFMVCDGRWVNISCLTRISLIVVTSFLSYDSCICSHIYILQTKLRTFKLCKFQVLTEYILISATSAVTVSIAGVVKEAVTIVVRTLYSFLLNWSSLWFTLVYYHILFFIFFLITIWNLLIFLLISPLV